MCKDAIAGLAARPFLNLRDKAGTLTLKNTQSKRCLMVCVHQTDRIQDVGEMLQVSYLAVFTTAVFICIKRCLESFGEFLVLTTDLFIVYYPKFGQLAYFQNV